MWLSSFFLFLCVDTYYCTHPHCQQLQIFFTIPVHPLCVTMHARLAPKSLRLRVSVLFLRILSNAYGKFVLCFQGKTEMDKHCYSIRDDLFKKVTSSP